ncbi:MAG: HAMP domain-containing histidine kinase [Firmicutes bacterium]|nr:HAMP domain-containing histidine kinase [Bacillota bacterium]
MIWALQIFFLSNSYETMKTREVSRIASVISRAYQQEDDNLSNSIQELSVNNDFYILMESRSGYLFFAPESESRLPVYTYMSHAPQLKSLLENSHGLPVSFKFNNGMEKYSTLAYGCVLNSSPGSEIYLYIFSPLYPVTSTVNILKNQLLYVTFITLLLAFVLAIYFATRISKPLKSITATAKEMGKGNYNVKFEGNSYSEINRLAATLNTASYELGMADNRQKDLIANVSHDLKTPLTMIRSYAEMIRDLSGDIPEKRNAHLKVIMDESDRLSQLVSDLTSVSAMQTHRIALEKDYFDLTEAAASILASYDILIERDGYSFEFNAQKDCLVYADETRIKQVIANLTTNAIKYCGDDKLILVTLRKIGRKCRFEVSDHGPGIKPEEIPHVWDRYYKTSSNYVRPTEGTGLGLSIVKEILTLHHANYGVNSKVGKGSVFWFELDIARKEREKTPREPRDRTKEIPQDPALIEEIVDGKESESE